MRKFREYGGKSPDVVRACKTVLEQTPPELASDIVTRGIVLTGGGALLHGIDELLRNELHIPICCGECTSLCGRRREFCSRICILYNRK
ncbi:MAG: rod shape-determining protein [Clostridium sp.]